MPIAAVPKYLGQDFKEASPGLRFGMFLKLWNIDDARQADLWTITKNKFPALDDAAKLNENDKRVMKELATRQALLARAASPGTLLQLGARAVAPFTTGLGNEHPSENGFAFLNPYGLPYLPGSGVKGVLKQAARELARGDWGDPKGWSDQKLINKEDLTLSPLDVMFGPDTNENDEQPVRGVLRFWDVIPQIAGNSLMVEVMTPHQGHYYQQKSNRRTGDSITPHDSGQPQPVNFLTVPPASEFTFFVTCDINRLKRLAPSLADTDQDTGDPQWKMLLKSAFEHAFQWLGFGAKTAVGYGAMESAEMRVQREEKAAARREEEQRLAEAYKREAMMANAEIWENARIKWNPRNQSLSVEKNNKSAIAVAPKGATLLASLPPEVRKKIESNQFVKAHARVAGGELLGFQE